MSGFQGLWKKFKNYADKEAGKSNIEVSGIEKDDDDIISEKSKISTLLMQAADDKTTVEIAFGSRILVYETKFKLDYDTDMEEAGSSELSSEYLRKGDYLLIGNIDPPEGNDKLRTTATGAGSSASLQFPQSSKFHEFHVRLIEELDARGTEVEEVAPVGQAEGEAEAPLLFKLEFPETIFRKKQRRASARFEVPETAKILLTVTRPAQETFRAALINIGAGGLNYMQPDGNAIITEQSHLLLKLEWPDEKMVEVPGTLVKNRTMSGKTQVHVRFSVETYEATRELGEAVAYIQRLSLEGSSSRRVS